MPENKTNKNREIEKNLAILKASNELLEECKALAIERGDVPESVLREIDEAKNQNVEYAKQNFGVDSEGLAAARYHGASVAEVRKYEERLKRKGITDEQVRRKSTAQVNTGVSAAEIEAVKKTKRTEIGIGKADDGEMPSDGTVKLISDTADAEKKPKKARRKRLTKKTEEKVEVENENPVEEENTNDKKSELVETVKEEPADLSLTYQTEPLDKIEIEKYNLQDIPNYVQFDMLPLPSNGECYKHKKNRIPVAYMTASDENILTSPNMYRDGKLIDVILRRKILDKDFNVDELCTGDRDAIAIWLRATSYGVEFPITATDPSTGKRYDTVIDLSKFKFRDFKLKSNENGFFEFKTAKGDLIEYKFLTKYEEDTLKKKVSEQISDYHRIEALKGINGVASDVALIKMDSEKMDMIKEDIDEMVELITETIDGGENLDHTQAVTEQMILHTHSVNGITDRAYIEDYINNMMVKDAYAYREAYTENAPGVNLTVSIEKPESDGGGSFNTFLRLDDTIFFHS